MDQSEDFEQLCAMAAGAHDGSELERFLVRVRDGNDVDENGHSPLWYCAVGNPHLSVAETLIAAGASVDYDLIRDSVVRNPRPEVPKLLYRRLAPLDKHCLNQLFLLAAASNRDDVLLSFFVSEGAEINATLPMDLYPAPTGDDAVFDEDWWDEDKPVMQNAIVVAIYENPEPARMVEILVSLGVDPDAVDAEGFPVLVHALDNREVVRTLIACGADVDIRDANGMTPLMHACAAEDNAVALALIRVGADVSLRSPQGETAMHHALGCHLCDNAEVIAALIAAGSDVNEPDGDGLLPLDLARANYASREVMEILERAGAVMGDVP